MLPSSTVENYLKAIYVGETHLAAGQKLVPMGQLAVALGIAPGTATTMVKALSESDLVVYEPYNGVRLTPAGQKLAARVLRRHRLIELFLVQVIGMKWDEVHDDAEQMEHVVSDRLIERIDEMLGQPEVDPHGDPIPAADGEMRTDGSECVPLSSVEPGAEICVARVTNQDPEFLRFLADSGLTIGAAGRVAQNSAEAGIVSTDFAGRPIALGHPAARQVQVRVGGAETV
ncbi:MAG: metal-dependent transcriptional regulator [Acidobacteriota bacterium]|nr:metal-dependent transcriptional regulator [Acidobacteriota bacterium]